MSNLYPEVGSNRGVSSRYEERHKELSAEEIFDRHPREITILMGWFITGHLTRLYKLFEGDMVLLIVLGEISHHNISPIFSSEKFNSNGESPEWNLDLPQEALQPCNAFSISEATGIPRETCRRKVQQLLKAGLLERHPSGGYVVTQGISEHYRDFNRETFTRWAKVAREINHLTPGPEAGEDQE